MSRGKTEVAPDPSYIKEILNGGIIVLENKSPGGRL